jgi:phospholipase C
MHAVSRRTFLAGLASAPLVPLPKSSAAALPNPTQSGIDHIVLVMMENRSFDHFLGWLPNAAGKQATLAYPDVNGKLVNTFHLTNFQNCQYANPDNSYAGGRVEFDNGGCDGWLKANTQDHFSIGYYVQSDLSFLGSAAPGWTVCDHYFSAILSSTYPNRIYQHAAQTDRISNTLSLSTLPTIWDRLSAAGVSGRYYFNDVPFLALWGFKYLPITRPYLDFLLDCAIGNLPAVSFVDPRFQNEALGTSNDDHPHADIRNGEAFLYQIYRAVTTGPQWKKTLLIITFDEWGGFFDHVPPPTAQIPPGDMRAGNLDGRLGFRIPALLISPRARRGYVDSMPFDHTSVLKLIEWRFGLPPLTVRDSTANNLALALNFNEMDLSAPAYDVPRGPFGAACASSPTTGSEDEEWSGLLQMARSYGFWSL